MWRKASRVRTFYNGLVFSGFNFLVWIRFVKKNKRLHYILRVLLLLLFVFQRWYNLFIVITVFPFFWTVCLVTLFTLPFMTLRDFYRLMTTEDFYTPRTFRFLQHNNAYLYPLDFLYLHFWRVPLSLSREVCLQTKENCLGSGGALSGSLILCMFYNLAVTFAQTIWLRTFYWLRNAPLRFIISIDSYQVTKDVTFTSFWFAYVFSEENRNGWL